jgi:hypothetical protein
MGVSEESGASLERMAIPEGRPGEWGLMRGPE